MTLVADFDKVAQCIRRAQTTVSFSSRVITIDLLG